MKSLKHFLVILMALLPILGLNQQPIKKDTVKIETLMKEQNVQMKQMKEQFAKLDSVMKARNIKIDTTKHK